ncbi:MAG: hypothetical protein EOO87_10140, partial [Pedobacter sp.]
MKTQNLIIPRWKISPIVGKVVLMLAIAVITLILSPLLIRALDEYAGLLDAGVWQLLLFTCISFLTMLSLSLLVFNSLISLAGLPTINMMVSQFKMFNSWQ